MGHRVALLSWPALVSLEIVAGTEVRIRPCGFWLGQRTMALNKTYWSCTSFAAAVHQGMACNLSQVASCLLDDQHPWVVWVY